MNILLRPSLCTYWQLTGYCVCPFRDRPLPLRMYVGEGPILPAALARHSNSSCIQSSGVLPKLKFQTSSLLRDNETRVLSGLRICLEGLRKTKKNFIWNSLCLDRNLNPWASQIRDRNGTRSEAIFELKSGQAYPSSLKVRGFLERPSDSQILKKYSAP